jgi:hypothetical protein
MPKSVVVSTPQRSKDGIDLELTDLPSYLFEGKQTGDIKTVHVKDAGDKTIQIVLDNDGRPGKVRNVRVQVTYDR